MASTACSYTSLPHDNVSTQHCSGQSVARGRKEKAAGQLHHQAELDCHNLLQKPHFSLDFRAPPARQRCVDATKRRKPVSTYE